MSAVISLPYFPLLADMEHVKQEAVSLSKTMNLSVVRLCFQAFLPDEHGRFTIPVEPVFSHKVYDSSKLPLNSTDSTIKSAEPFNGYLGVKFSLRLFLLYKHEFCCQATVYSHSF